MLFSQKGLSILSIIIIVVVFGATVGGAFVLINNEKAHTRDAVRLSDMTRVQAAFEFLYNQQASYALAAENGCNQAGMLVSQCSLGEYYSTINQLEDPGKYQYKVSTVPTENEYGITFTLEKDYQNLTAGEHLLTQDGIQ